MPIVPIAHTLVAVPMLKGVSGYVPDPLGHHNFASVDVGG